MIGNLEDPGLRRSCNFVDSASDIGQGWVPARTLSSMFTMDYAIPYIGRSHRSRSSLRVRRAVGPVTKAVHIKSSRMNIYALI